MRKDIRIDVNSKNNKFKIDNKTLGITSENLQGKIIFKPEPFVDGTCRMYIDGRGSILMDKEEDCYTVNILSSLLTEDSLDVCFKITEPETEDGIPIFCSKIMKFKVLETIDSSSTIPEDYPSWEQVLDSMMAQIEQMEEDAEDRLDEVVGQIQDLTSQYNSNASSKVSDFNSNAASKKEDFNSNATNKTSAYNLNASNKLNDLDAYTEQKKEEIEEGKDDLIQELSDHESDKESELDSYTNAKKSELNTYTTTKKGELDDYEDDKESELSSFASGKTSDFNTNASSKISAYNTNATEKTTEYNSNHTEKLGAYNDNATSKTSAFNENASDKTDDFDDNATSKLGTYNSNHTEKLGAYNDNATSKTTAFNENAEDKTDDFNDNASAKTTAFNNNATVKTNEYNANADEVIQANEELRAVIESELDTNTVEGTTLDVTDSAEYRGKVDVKGNAEQEQLSGKNLLPYPYSNTTRTVNGLTFSDNGDGTVTVNGTATATTLFYLQDNSTTFKKEILNKDIILSGCPKGGGDNTYRLQLWNYDQNNGFKYDNGDGTSPFSFSNIDGSYNLVIRIASGATLNNLIFKPMVRLASISDNTYEPYCGGQASPNPDYPQEIKVVTGDNVVKHFGKNLFNYITNFRPSGNGLTNILNSDGSISVSGTPNSQYTRVVNETDITDILKDNTTYTASQSIFRTDEKNVSIEIRRFRADESTSYIKVSKNSNKVSFTVDKSEFVRYTISFLTNTVQPLNFTTTLQLEEGTTPTPYEPYREEEYNLNLGTIELCKIGDAEDFFFKNTPSSPYYNNELEENAWYKYGAIRRYDTIDSESSVEITSKMYRISVKYRSQLHDMSSDTNVIAAAFSRCDVVDMNSEKPQVSVRYNYGWGGIAALYNAASIQLIGEKTKAELLEWFNNNEVLYIVINPTYDYIDYTEITDPTLISQLEALNKAKWFKGINHWWTETENLEPNLKGTYKQSNNLRLQALEQAVVALGGV